MQPLDSHKIREQWLAFGKKYEHADTGSASLIPDAGDKTVLFNTAGMQPLVPYLMGKEHPMGTRLFNIQKCVRTGDIEDVGDERHLTFFEMMGNWSLGDYFKKESLAWSLDLLVNDFGIEFERIGVTIFSGEGVDGI